MGDLAIVTIDKLRNTLRKGHKIPWALHILIGIKVSNYLWIPLSIIPGNRQTRRRRNLTRSPTGWPLSDIMTKMLLKT